MKRGILAVVLVALLLAAGCAQKGAEGTGGEKVATAEGEEYIKIGVVLPLTGKASTTGNDMWQAAQMAAEEINAKGGVKVGDKYMKIKLIQGDTETNPEKGVEAVTRLITSDNVDILVGGFSSAITYADSAVAAREGVPFIITGASTPMITRRTDIDTSWFFHHCPTTDDFSSATLQFAHEVIRPEVNKKFGFSDDRKLRVAIIYQDTKYGKGVLDGVKKAIASNPDWKLEIVAEEPFAMGESNFQTVLTKVKEAKPDVVYAATFLNEQVPLVTQARRDVGLNTIFMAVEATDDPDYYSQVGEYGDYSIQESRFSPYTVPQGSIRERAMKFREDFKAKYNDYPSMMGASTYEGIYIAAKAIEMAGSLDKQKVKEALTNFEMPEIVEAMKDGKISFKNEYRESSFQLYMEQLRYNPEIGEPRPKIVWPDNLKEAEFELPEWYQAGS